MSVHRLSRLRPVLVALAVCCQLSPPAARAEESPLGKVVDKVVPVNNRLRSNQHILGKMLTREGKPYDEATAREDVARLMKSNWFAPNGVEIKTAITPTGKVMVFVHVQELQSVVNKISFVGNKHYSERELHEALALSQVRQGAAMNPANNRYAAAQLTQKLKEDGRLYAQVALLKGDSAADEEVVFNIVEGPVVRVGRVDFRGNGESCKSATEGRLRTVVNTKPAKFGVPTLLTERFVAAKLNEDVLQLIAYYRRLGYLDAQVQPQWEPNADFTAVNVTFLIREGRMYSVRSVKMEGNQSLPQERLLKNTDLQVSKPYDETVVQADLKRVTMTYGYAGRQVGVEPGVFLVPGQPGVVDVIYKVYEPERVSQQRPGDGPPVPLGPSRLGEIRITGNSVTQDRVILNQLIGLNPGQILEFPRIEEARQNLIRLGIFDNDPPPIIEVLPPKDPDSPFRDVQVTVKETRTGMVGLQFGVNSNSGINGTLTVNQRNFDILRVPTSMDDLLGGKAFRGGGQELRLQAMPGTVFQRYEATWREPFLFDRPIGLTNSIYYSGRQFLEYSESRIGDRVTVDRRLDEYGVWHANASARVEGINLYNIPDYAPPAITKDNGGSFLVGLRGGINRDTRDSFLMPTTGSVLDFSVEQVLGTNRFPIGTIEGTKFWTVHQARDGGWKGVVALRSQMTMMADNAPVYERIYGGGFRSLRGFTYRGVGPFEALPGQPSLNVGGTFSFLNTAEYQIPLMANEMVRFVTFVDHGTIENSVAIRDYRVSVGLGLRISVPAFGPLPIALDFAFPVRKGPQDNKQIFSFYVGWIGGQ